MSRKSTRFVFLFIISKCSSISTSPITTFLNIIILFFVSRPTQPPFVKTFLYLELSSVWINHLWDTLLNTHFIHFCFMGRLSPISSSILLLILLLHRLIFYIALLNPLLRYFLLFFFLFFFFLFLNLLQNLIFLLLRLTSSLPSSSSSWLLLLFFWSLFLVGLGVLDTPRVIVTHIISFIS